LAALRLEINGQGWQRRRAHGCADFRRHL